MIKNLFAAREHPSRQGKQFLRDIIASSKTGEVLHYVPERLAAIIDKYDTIDIDPHFRNDIYNILQGSIELSEAMVDPTFPVEDASEQIAKQMEILARILRYLNQRPSRVGYSILIPHNQMLIGQFGTQEAAEHHLEDLRNLGTAISSNAIVVPVKIMSQHAVQPRPANLPTPRANPSLSGPIPPGIIPSQPAPQRAVELEPIKEQEPQEHVWQEPREAVQNMQPRPDPLAHPFVIDPPPTQPTGDEYRKSMQERLDEIERAAEEFNKPKPR